jgi:hypothetical protein
MKGFFGSAGTIFRSFRIELLTVLVVAAVLFAVALLQRDLRNPLTAGIRDAVLAPSVTDVVEPAVDIETTNAVNVGQRRTDEAGAGRAQEKSEDGARYLIGDAGYVDAYIAARTGTGSATGVHLDDELGAEWNAESDQEADSGLLDTDRDESPVDTEEAAEEAQDFARDKQITGQVFDSYGMPLSGVRIAATAERLFDVPVGVPVSAQDVRRESFSDGSGSFYFDRDTDSCQLNT